MIQYATRPHFGNVLLGGLKPPSGEPLSEWITKNFHLSREYSELTGLMELWPWQVGMADAVTDPQYDEISVMKSARTGATAILILATTAYYAVEDPCPIQIVLPGEQAAEDFSTEMLTPMIRDNPLVKARFGRSVGRQRDPNNKVLRKSFEGGFAVLTGANSGVNFRRRNVKVALGDEIDEWPHTIPGQGPPLMLLAKRTMAYRDRLYAKISTPTILGESAIEGEFGKSNKQYFKVPCFKCGVFQAITLDHLVWPKGKPHKAEFECQLCGHLIPESKKMDLQVPGFWEATAPEVKMHAGFHIWQAYSFHPRASWGNIAKEHSEAKTSVEARKAFTTLVLGEPAELHDGDSISSNDLYNRREEYDAEDVCPDGVLVAVMAVDTQEHFLEGEIKGFGHGEESWGLCHFQIHGDPGQPEVWMELDKFLFKKFKLSSGVEIPVSITGVDSGGHHADSVYAWVNRHQGRRVYALKGASVMGKPIAARPKHLPGTGTPFVLVGTDTTKDLMFSRLRLEEEGPGFYHWSLAFDDSYFTQLGVEKRIKVKSRGGMAWRYQKVPINAPNESTDLNVYAISMIRTLNPSFKAIERRLAKRALELDLPPKVETQHRRPTRKRKGKYKPGTW